MIRIPSDVSENKATEPPAPEVLRAQSNEKKAAADSVAARSHLSTQFRHSTYRPSHKATFIGLAVVVTILAVNAAVIVYIVRNQNKTSSNTKSNEVTISSDVLGKLGVSRNPVSNSGTELTVGPDANFKGKVTVASDISVGGQLNLNGKLSAASMSLNTLQAGATALDSLNVNGDGTMSNLNVREDLTVDGSTKLQGTVTIGQLLTVYNNINVLGNLSIGGTLSMGNFQTNILTVGGHIITRGSAPGYNRGSVLRSTDTISLSGNDVAGTLAVNIGTGSIGAGCLASMSFVSQYANIPHVVVTAIGPASDVYTFRSASGFSICVASGLSNGSYAFDYIVMQ